MDDCETPILSGSHDFRLETWEQIHSNPFIFQTQLPGTVLAKMLASHAVHFLQPQTLPYLSLNGQPMPQARSPNVHSQEYFSIEDNATHCISVKVQAPSTVVLLNAEDIERAKQWTNLQLARVRFTTPAVPMNASSSTPQSSQLYDRFFSVVTFYEDNSSLVLLGDFADTFPFFDASDNPTLCMTVVNVFEELDSGGEVCVAKKKIPQNNMPTLIFSQLPIFTLASPHRLHVPPCLLHYISYIYHTTQWYYNSADNLLSYHVDAANHTEIDFTTENLSLLGNTTFSFPTLLHIMELQGNLPICHQKTWDSALETSLDTLEEYYCDERYNRFCDQPTYLSFYASEAFPPA
jgi:hypothetical protein